MDDEIAGYPDYPDIPADEWCDSADDESALIEPESVPEWMISVGLVGAGRYMLLNTGAVVEWLGMGRGGPFTFGRDDPDALVAVLRWVEQPNLTMFLLDEENASQIGKFSLLP